jgi:hypothetical protein
MFLRLNKKIFALLIWLILSLGFSCNSYNKIENKATVPRDINSVMEAHTKELMSIPGVVGVYIGELVDHTPCIGVMIVEKTQELEKKIPKTLEGYPVWIEVSGEIKPMK